MKTTQNQREEKQFWDDAAATFDIEPDHGLLDPVARNAWSELLLDHLPPAPASVLDIGCGTGTLSLLLAEQNYQLTGIDFSEKMIERSKSKAIQAGFNIPFIEMDAFEPEFNGKLFDAIVCRHVLWALPDPAIALQRWAQLLAPKGRLLLIEGYWNTDSGLYSQQIIEALPSEFTSVSTIDLSNQSILWGKAVDDERYLVVAK